MAKPDTLDAYRPIVGDVAVEELRALARPLAGRSVQHINATRVGGGVAEILGRLVPLMNELGLDARWDVIEGEDAFWRVTKSFHNAMQGQPIEIAAADYELYLAWNRKNRARLDLAGDYVVVHDPQPAALVAERPAPSRKRKGGGQRLLWRCHIDASHPHRGLWAFLERCVRRYDAAIFSAPQFTRALPMPQFLLAPSIDPLSDKNRPLDPAEVRRIVEKHQIDPDRPSA